MMRPSGKILMLASILLLGGVPTFAHHSEAAQFDPDDPVSVEGVITKVEWQNPHIWFYIDVTEANGEVTTWGFSGFPPGTLLRRGITKDVFKLGDVIRVTGNRARDGSNNASGYSVTFADGRNVFAAPGIEEEAR